MVPCPVDGAAPWLSALCLPSRQLSPQLYFTNCCTVTRRNRTGERVTQLSPNISTTHQPTATDRILLRVQSACRATSRNHLRISLSRIVLRARRHQAVHIPPRIRVSPIASRRPHPKRSSLTSHHGTTRALPLAQRRPKSLPPHTRFRLFHSI